MSKLTKTLFTGSTALLASSQLMYAAATRVAYVDPFATARGNAFTATADNASAVFYNGAGLTQLEGSEVQANVFAISLEYEYEGASGSDSMDDDFQAIPSFFAAHNFEDRPIAIGFGAYAPFALGSDWGSDASFASFPFGLAVPYEAELDYIKYHAVIAWQISETLSIAAGASYDDTDIELKANALEFEGDGDDIGFSFSVLWQPSVKHSFGFNYQAKTQIEFEGTADILFPVTASVPTSGTLDFPESVVVGYSFRPNEKWNIELNVDWTHWDRVDSLTLEGVPGATYELNWEDAFIWELGATRYFDNGWNVSAGYTFVESAVPANDLLPVVPDRDRHFFAVGVGRAYDNFFWQATYQYAYSDKLKVKDNTFPTANGEYDLDSQAVAFTLGYRW